MALFSMVSPLLQELDRQGVAAYGSKWDDLVKSATEDLALRYGDLRNRNRKLIDYSSLPVQMAYALTYVAGHSDFLHQVLYLAEKPADVVIIDRSPLRITSLGGGPGSDLLAIFKFIRELPASARPDKMVYRVLDKQPNWHESLKIVADAHRALIDTELVFEKIDVTIEDQWKCVSFAEDDVVIMNFFVSEVCALREAGSVKRCFTQLLRSMRENALLIFNDSNFWTVVDFFDTRVRIADGFVPILSDSAKLVISEFDYDDFLRSYLFRFDRNPKQHSNAAFRVLRKK